MTRAQMEARYDELVEIVWENCDNRNRSSRAVDELTEKLVLEFRLGKMSQSQFNTWSFEPSKQAKSLFTHYLNIYREIA